MNRKSMDGRIWARVIKGPGCWEWQGCLNPNGYGIVNGRGHRGMSPVKVHRLVYEDAFGSIPAGLSILHKCDNPKCVRPSHLECGTQSKNMADAYARGRMKQKRGIQNSRAKFTKEQALEIREAVTAGESMRSVAMRFKVSHPTIRRVMGAEYA